MNPPARITVDPAHMDGKPCVRGLPIKFWDVYRDLTFHGMREETILHKYPGLEPEDLAAVREYAVYLIKSRDHDEITGRKILPKDRLVDGRYYKGRCRLATVARWSASRNCFYHWREKMGYIYIETIMYPTDEEEPWWDVFDVIEELPNSPFEIPFDLDAEFHGDPDLLNTYAEEIWGKTLYWNPSDRSKNQTDRTKWNVIVGRGLTPAQLLRRKPVSARREWYRNAMVMPMRFKFDPAIPRLRWLNLIHPRILKTQQ